MLPTAFLPVLPKAQYTLHPLDPREIASLTSILREMYLPPVHGGLDASDVFYDDQSNGQETSQETEKQRRFSKGLAESIGTLNLSSDGGGTSALFGRHLRSEDAAGGDGEATPRAGSGTATPIPISRSASRAPYIDGPIHSTSNDGSGGSDTDDSDEDEDEDEEAEADNAHLDPFEREWAQKWLQGVVRRAQTWIEQTGDELGTGEMDDDGYDMKSVEGVLKDSTAVLAVMAGTGAAGSLTRHLLFPISPSITPGLIAQQTSKSQAALSSGNAAYSPETRTFLASLIHANNTIGTNPSRRARSSTVGSVSSSTSTFTSDSATSAASSSASPTAQRTCSQPNKITNGRKKRQSRHRHRRPAIPILLHDAPISDHLDVGVQTWGSAILLGRELAMRPEKFGLFPQDQAPATSLIGDPSGAPSRSSHGGQGGVRVLELGAGTGLLGILCRKLLDLHTATLATPSGSGTDGTDGSFTSTRNADEAKGHLVLATDFLPSVLNNLQICIDLNFPSSPIPLSTLPSNLNPTDAAAPAPSTHSSSPRTGVEVAKLDWVTFPAFAERYYATRSDIRISPKQSSSTLSSRESQTAGHAPWEMKTLKYPLERTIARPQPKPSPSAQHTDSAASADGHDADEADEDDAENPMMPYMDAPFDLVLVSDCVYDPTHAQMIRQVAGWVLRPPNPNVEGDVGGTMHILSPLRPTFAPELQSIDTHFPILSTYPPPCPPCSSSPNAQDGEHGVTGDGEGLGYAQGLRIGTRGSGKRSVRGKKGEGRVDEEGGYWWWEVGWG